MTVVAVATTAPAALAVPAASGARRARRARPPPVALVATGTAVAVVAVAATAVPAASGTRAESGEPPPHPPHPSRPPCPSHPPRPLRVWSTRRIRRAGGHDAPRRDRHARRARHSTWYGPGRQCARRRERPGAPDGPARARWPPPARAASPRPRRASCCVTSAVASSARTRRASSTSGSAARAWPGLSRAPLQRPCPAGKQNPGPQQNVCGTNLYKSGKIAFYSLWLGGGKDILDPDFVLSAFACHKLYRHQIHF